jgi:uncharacterized Tic20 family protein
MTNTIHRWPAVAGMFAAPFYLTLIVVLGALEPGFSHLTKPMSMLGGVPSVRGLAFNLGVASTGVLIIAFGIGLWMKLPPKTTARIGSVLLVIGGLGLNGAAYFHCNEGCKNTLTEPDVVGRLHIVFSLLGGMGTALAPFFVWSAMRGDEKWKGLATPTLVTAILANLPGITFWITIATGFRLPSIEGLIQRLGFVIVLIWIFFVATRLWRLTCPGSQSVGASG